MWRAAGTNTHQDHVIAHVIGASPLTYFVWDETAYLLLDIGFMWNIYLDGEMGLVPQTLAFAELLSDNEHLDQQTIENLTRPVPNPSPIQSVDFFESENGRRLVLNCESGNIVLETSFLARDIQIDFKE